MRATRFFWLPVIVLVCAGAFAQSTSVGQHEPPTEIRIGDSLVPLAGPWRFAPGDSPVANGTLKWADPAFDDSAWAAMDLHSKAGEIDPAYGSSGYLTGWSAHGYPKLAGFAWYRLRIQVANAGQPLAIKTPDNVDDAFQVFANGKLIGSFGEFTAKGVVCYRARSKVFALPSPDSNGDMLVGAVRTRADETSDSAAILRTLNDRLLGRAGGHFATCLAAHLGTDGTMRVANAGHIPPYRNGAAMELPGVASAGDYRGRGVRRGDGAPECSRPADVFDGRRGGGKERGGRAVGICAAGGDLDTIAGGGCTGGCRPWPG